MRRELVDTESELEAAVSDYERMGWEVAERSRERVVLSRGLRGSWLWHLLFLVLIPIVANLCYSAYRRYNRPEGVVIRRRGAAAETADAGETPDTVDDDAEESGH